MSWDRSALPLRKEAARALPWSPQPCPALTRRALHPSWSLGARRSWGARRAHHCCAWNPRDPRDSWGALGPGGAWWSLGPSGAWRACFLACKKRERERVHMKVATTTPEPEHGRRRPRERPPPPGAARIQPGTWTCLSQQPRASRGGAGRGRQHCVGPHKSRQQLTFHRTRQKAKGGSAAHKDGGGAAGKGQGSKASLPLSGRLGSPVVATQGMAHWQPTASS